MYAIQKEICIPITYRNFQICPRCTSLKILNLGNNEITTLNEGLFSNVNELRDLTISHNKITHISSNAFIGLGKLEYLDLSHNKIADIKDDAFVPVQALKDLNLGENDFPHLPTRGLGNLEHLKTFHNKNLQERIPANQLPNVQTLVLSYAYHCCDFTQNSKKQQKANVEISENVEWLKPDFSDTFNDSIMEDNGSDSISRGIEQHLKDQEIFYDNAIMHEYVVPDYVETEAQSDNEVVNIAPISCEPMPGPFLPCDELFGWWSLRCGVWIVFLLALLGNGIVLFVSISGRAKMDVPRFLICNLACADFCMGIYLGILAIVDASTLDFKAFANL
ncbi:hypothetical protein KUTeg_023503 [Tegillarca granosa]|uniref:Uncharacterized protein n=1 Tax=Tegillarca granosa TaxID=220873 RepID=A0ABQ9E809_TEGGR|nr:hypothetical protein KUTeg_023503 [Tegillarca granosa]